MPKIIEIGKCLFKLQLKMSVMFFETRCISSVQPGRCVGVGDGVGDNKSI